MDSLNRNALEENLHKKLHTHIYSYAEDSVVVKITKNRNGILGDGDGNKAIAPQSSKKSAFRTTFFKSDHERKKLRIQQKIGSAKLPPIVVDHKPLEEVLDETRSSTSISTSESSSLVSGAVKKDIVPVTWEHVLSAYQVPLELDQNDSPVYDIIKPFDSNVIKHILRLRSALGWRTMLPRHGPGVRQAMNTTDHKNPLQEALTLKEDTGEYVYAILEDQNASLVNPFALKAVSANDARTKDIFYTITATSVTKWIRVDEVFDSEITPVIWWLYEQRLFNMICDFTLFTQFRLWKQFQVWKLVVRAGKVSTSKQAVSRCLFSIDTRLQKCILHVRGICEDVCGSRDGIGVGQNAITLLKCDSRKIYELSEFAVKQENAINRAMKQLAQIRTHVINLAESVCTEFAEKEGISKLVRLGKISCKQFVSHESSDVTDTTYTQLASWRRTLSRLSSFISLLDHVIQEMLNRLVATATEFLLSFLVVSNRDGKCSVSNEILSNRCAERTELYNEVTRNSEANGYRTLKDTSRTKLALESTECSLDDIFTPKQPEVPKQDDKFCSPLFRVFLVLEVVEAEERSSTSHISSYSNKKISAQRTSVVRFDTKKSFSSRSRDSIDSSTPDEDESARTSRRQSVVSEQSGVGEAQSEVVLSPSKSDFLSSIEKIVEGFKQAIYKTESICNADELKDFTQAPAFDIRFEWSDLDIGKEKDEEGVDKIREKKKVLINDAEYNVIVQEIFENVEQAMDKAFDYSLNYNKYCLMVDESRAMDVDGALKEQEWTPEEFAGVLYKFTEMTKEIREMKSSKRMAMFQVDAKGFAKSALPYAQTVVDAVHRWLPMVTTRHNEDLLTVVRRATRKLDSDPETVEMFVEHLTFLARTTTEMPALDSEYLTVTRFFKIIKDYGVWLDPEQLAIFQTLIPAFQHLKTTLLFCEAKKDENISKFSSDLDGHIHTLRYQLFDLRNKVIAPYLLSGETLSVAALESIKLLADEVEVLVVKARSYANYQDRFGSSYSTSSSKRVYTVEALIAAESADNKVSAAQLQAELSEVERDITLRKLLWDSSDEWIKLEQEWKNSEFRQLDIDSLQENVARFMQTVFMLEKGLPKNEILPRLKEAVLNFKQNMPLIAALRNKHLKQRHWDDIQYVIGRSLARDASQTLGDLLKLRLVQHRETIMEISTRATNEATLEAMLGKLKQQWHESDFKLVSHTSATQTVMIISTAEEIWSQLEESQITIATIKGSRYVAPIKTEVEDWERRLMLFARTLDEWMKCQRNWLYLEPVFTTADIQRQLPQDASLFNQVNQIWRDLMRRTEDRPHALRAGTGAGVLESLQSCNTNLEKIQKSLEDYLDIKRLAFPRFYFLSNDELLSVLSQGKDPSSIQSHLAKCFANIRYLDIRHSGSKQPTVHSMISAEGEVVRLPSNVKARGSVEQWLSSVESAMYDTIRKHLKIALMGWSTLPETLPTWIFQNPGQVALTVAQIMFNKNVSNAFASGMPINELTKIHKDFMESLNVLSETVSNQQIVSHQYFTLEAMIIIYVHMRDIVSGLIKSEITNRDDFEWNRQLLYEWQDMTNMCRVIQADARFAYGCEYIGCASRLVVTPLTDRCFLTLTGALNLHLGGSPAGPAGTGKSETVKDLAKILGKQCVVFNCSEGIDFKMMGQFFSGLSQSGSWCCFDEFNRIDVEVLSVIASQVHSIKAAKDAQALRFQFEGKEIRLNPTCAYFITMNPGYRGRVELPDNLKSMFRPVAMMVPDYALITEIILFSEGFREAKLFSRKVVNLYELASKQLSQQDHYDFGMRAIKSVLVMAGQKKRETITNQRNMSEQAIRDQERSVLIHSLKNANLPRFLAEDAPLFHSIMSDLFPGITSSPIGSSLLKKCIKQSIADLNLEKWPDQIQKVIQLNEQLAVRHGVMLVGPSGGGKTTVRTVLQKALGAYYHNITLGEERIGRRKKFVETFIINPKCITLGELYGFTDPNTLEWADGLLAYIVRKFAKELSNSDYPGSRRPKTSVSFQDSQGSRDTPGSLKSESSSLKTAKSDDVTDLDWRWIILDGPVDTAWVENLNTALDDTKTLCLANGERINLPDNMRLIFEVDSLSKASPATISRCAMVYMDPVELGWKPFVKSWMAKLPKAFPEYGRDHLWRLFELGVEPGLQLLDRRIKFQHLPVPHLCIIQSLCRILRAIFAFMEKHGGYGDADLEEDEESGRSKSASRSRSKAASEKQGTSLMDLVKSSGSNMTPGRWFLESYPDKLCPLLGKIFVFAYTWSFGGVLSREDDQEDDTLISTTVIGRDETLINMSYDFDHFVHDLFEKDPIVNVNFPSGSKSVFSYFIDLQTGRFTPWDSLVPLTRTLIERGLTYSLVGGNKALLSDRRKSAATDSMAALVPTTDTVRYSFLAALLLLGRNPVLLTGDSGVGKTALLQNILNKLSAIGGTETDSGTILGDVFRAAEKTSAIIQSITSLGLLTQSEDAQDNLPDDADSKMSHSAVLPKQKTGDLLVNMIQFSALTQPQQCQSQILNKLVKRSRDILGPPRGKKCIAFVNDLNMPVCDEHGAQPPLELVRQFLDLNGFYDVKKLVWKSVTDVTIAATAAPPGGGRSAISERTLKHFSVLALPQPSTRSLQHIYQVQLGHFVENRDFMPEVKECCNQVVNAAIAVYYKMCNAMLPTPNKSHYTFNLRDLSAVIKGVLQADESVIVSRETIAQLFAHEATRVFHDRLTDDEDRKTFYQFLSDDLHNYFKITIASELLWSNPFIFGDFTDLNAPSTTRTYRQLPSYDTLSAMLEEYYMRTSSSSVNTAHLVFFEAAINHVIRAARAFRQPGTHMMLVGIDGTGKSTTCKLAARIAGCQLFRLSIVRGYTIVDFREELKKIHRQCGVSNISTVFLLTDADLVSEEFLEDINCMLNTGEDAELFDADELDAIVMDIKQVAIANDVHDSRAAMLEFFRRRVNANLHIAIATSPAGGTFRHRCRTHPALVNCCTIDWYDRWPEAALTSVACSYFSKDNSETIRMNANNDFDDTKASVDADKVSSLCVQIHFSATAAGEKLWEEMRRRYYTTPTTYLEFIQLFTKMLEDNKENFNKDLRRLHTGLHKLAEAKSLVNIMQEELVGLGPKIEQKARDTDRLLIQLRKDTEAVNEVREIVRQEEATMRSETQLVQDFAHQAAADLQSVLPALQNAVLSLDSLDKSDIAELRVYKNPPQMVLTVMNAVCILLQTKEDWPSAKQLLTDPLFLKKLVLLDRDAIPTRVFNKLKKLTRNPEFNVDRVGEVSTACKSICMWVLALQHYNDVKRMVEPKQRRVQEAREALEVAQENLKNKQASLNKIQRHLTQLKLKYEESVNQQEELKERKIITGKRLQRASMLISALVDEEGRWKESVEKLKKKLTGLVGDTIVSSASVAYLGPFIRSYRDNMTSEWLLFCKGYGVQTSFNYDLVKMMGDGNQIRTWHNQGLPRDVHSTVNAVVIHAARRWPLIVDPQGQATNWIKQMEKSNLRVVYASDSNYMKSVENAIRVGEALLLCDVEESLDPELRPVLQRELSHRSGQDYISIGGSEISYNHNFRLYMTTSKANPHFLPAVCIAVTIINFGITFEGLQGQLLSSVVTHERPHLEAQRGELLNNIATDMKLLQESEDKALFLLETQQGHILDDEDLITTLKQSKLTSAEVLDRLQESEENEAKTEAARSRYLPVATRGAVLYFVLADLEILNSMYQFSLQWFTDKFLQCVGQAHSKDPSEKQSSSLEDDKPSSESDGESVAQDGDYLDIMLQKMIDVLTLGVYKVVSYSLFNEHQIIFSFLLATAIMRNNERYHDQWRGLGTLTDHHWNVFLHTRALTSMIDVDSLDLHSGETGMEKIEDENGFHLIRSASLDWISKNAWRQSQYISWKLPSFQQLCLSLLTQSHLWEQFLQHQDPYHFMEIALTQDQDETSFNWNELTSFEKLLLIKVLRPECLLPSVRWFVHDLMGEDFVESGGFNLKQIFASSQSTVPLIFILSPGTDPSAQLLRYAKEVRGSSLHVDMVSLGRGQGPKAEDLIHKAQILKGRWVFLQNCHLAASFMPRLQAIVEELSSPSSDIDSEFRLWLSSKPDPSFPVPILQNGLKMAVEPPRGIRSHLQLAFGAAGSGEVTSELYEYGSNHQAWKPLLFSLCCFNALAHERRKFGTLGFNLPYDFTSSDLEVSVLMLKQLLEGAGDVPWSALLHLTGEVVYGGRVTDDWDRRCLVSTLSKFYCDDTLLSGHTFSRDGIFRPPDVKSKFSEVRDYINTLPLLDPPDVFGMHDNAERAHMESEANRLIEVVIQVQPKLATASVLETGKTDAEIVSELTKDMLQRLPSSVERDEQGNESERDDLLTLAKLLTNQVWQNLLNKADKQDQENEDRLPILKSALLTVARQEIDRFNKLLETIHTSLRALNRAIDGEIVMSESLERTFDALLQQKVPESWQSVSYESCKLLGSWLEDLIQRIDFFAKWSKLVVSCVQAKVGFTHKREPVKKSDLQVANTQKEEPTSYWLSAFFFPQGFLTGVLQNYARKHKVPVDALTFRFDVQNYFPDNREDSKTSKFQVSKVAFRQTDHPLQDGVRIFGLFLDSARWDLKRGMLVDSLPNIRYFEMPEIFFIPNQNSSIDAEKVSRYECPLYRTSVRAGALSSTGHSTNFVSTVALRSDQHPDYWTLQGTAMLSQLDN